MQAKLFGPAYFDGAIHWRAHCDLSNRAGDVVGRHRLEKYMWQTHLVAIG
jgi:hypothetical protein